MIINYVFKLKCKSYNKELKYSIGEFYINGTQI